jgi:hypothetical protein
LRFVDADEKDALRIYLSERLDALPKTVRFVAKAIANVISLIPFRFTGRNATYDVGYVAG